MKTRILLTLLMLCLAAACQPLTAPQAPRAEITPFPTTTPGRVVRGELSLANALAASGLSSPATAVALARQPTATPDFATCPPLSTDVPIEENAPTNAQVISEEIVRYLNNGGNVAALIDVLRDDWGILGEAPAAATDEVDVDEDEEDGAVVGFVRDDTDLTGEGTPEIIISYTIPNDNGALLVLGCAAGQYALFYQTVGDTPTPPQVVTLGDMNYDSRLDFLLGLESCARDDAGALIPETCEYIAELLEWQPETGELVNILTGDPRGSGLPTATDIDQDNVSEVVVRRENRGTPETGPLFTGTDIYDWNGENYVLSITQPDPPRFQVQVVHQGDRAFSRRQWNEAVPLYQVALNDDDLRDWFGDTEREFLRAYTQFKQLVALTAAGSPNAQTIYDEIIREYPDAAAQPFYILMTQVFWQQYSQAQDLADACTNVRQQITTSVDLALDPLNRYGSRSPQYTAEDICPF